MEWIITSLIRRALFLTKFRKLQLEDLHRQLQTLQKEKSDRMKQVMDHLSTLNSLLAAAIDGLREVKRQRMQKLQDLASSMLELCNLMDTLVEEQQMFQNVTCNIAASENEITEPNTLSDDFISYVATEFRGVPTWLSRHIVGWNMPLKLLNQCFLIPKSNRPCFRLGTNGASGCKGQRGSF
ncbi:hypothetical protein MKX01_042516 [Papaver californicum]|nr:hypothetical protein MKX01_042516 [Papaver californicum]